MTDATAILGGLAIGFFCGSVPFGYLLVRFKTGGDVRDVGSGNIGATNVSRALGAGGGVLTLLLDAAKGVAGVWLAGAVGASVAGAAGAWAWSWAGALGAVLGHCYTPWLRLRGGKGVATLLGAFGAAALAPTAIAALALATVLGLTRTMSLASLCATLVLPLVLLWWRYPPLAVASSVIAALVIYWRHRANIGRILRGEESKLGSSRA